MRRASIEEGTVIEITVLALNGHRLLIRGITDSPILLRSAAVITLPSESIPDPPPRKALKP
jgi:hypothetical protein